ncbi:phosphotransferase [Corynebacterium tapiri]|uniref:Aminoglycoside phosphotransferase domain-containing protein n=1 Tax=Corynebacterium tapiri TaxID=1448266 RepID=A0A5C4U2C7_9CORY|nr:phosphotransferase [Corynebacterium tapiri]TNL96608.1 hypothetical protein FHE74_07885 [Corynebacterium tapiri]
MDYAELLASSRFYGAKSEPIDSVDLLDEHPLDQFQAQLIQVHHAGASDMYQLLLDSSGNEALSTPAGALAFARGLGELGEVEGSVEIPPSADARPISGEQSNTSFLVPAEDPQLIIKAFRKLEPGLSPDVELLTQIPDCPYIAPVRGWVTRHLGTDVYTLAMAQDFVANAQDGWELALGYVQREESFTRQAHELGRAIRGVHRDLAEAFGTDEVSEVSLAMRLQDHAGDILERTPQLRQYEEGIAEVYRALRDTDTSIQRIHGDLHLGQTLRTPDRFVLIDFEGEPARPLAQRRLPDSPLRDLAGMLRSLDYAAHFDGAHPSWAASASDALLDGYDIDQSALLNAYLLDKALYEVDYELNNRPDWAEIPLNAIERILNSY